MNWIIVPDWQRFQHYGLARQPTWIKNSIGLLHKDEYLDLPMAARGLLHGIWLAYADRDGLLKRSELPEILGQPVEDSDLAALLATDWIEFHAEQPFLTIADMSAGVRAEAIMRQERER